MDDNIQKPNAKNLLSIGEAADYLGVSIDTLRRWEKRGRVIPLRSPGGHRYYTADELDKLFNKKYIRDETIKEASIETDENTIPAEVKDINQSENPVALSGQNEINSATLDRTQTESNPSSVPEITPPDANITTQPPQNIESPHVNIPVDEIETVNQPEVPQKENIGTTSILEPVKPEIISLKPDTEERISNILNYETMNSKPAKKRDNSMILIIAITIFTLLDLLLFFLWYSSTKIVIPIP